MDSLSQILLGAATGELVAGKRAGNKALLWGAICGTIPDLDVLAQNFLHPVDALAFHRGMTHSIVFSIILAPLMGYLIKWIHPKNEATRCDWTFLAFIALFTHPLLDCFTTWGTQLFWPFSDYRVAIKSIFVIDPLYTLPLLITTIWLAFLRKDSAKRRKLNFIGLSISSFYLLITLFLKGQANGVFEQSYEKQGIAVNRYESKPSPLNTILWSSTLETDSAYYIGHYSFLDQDKEVRFFPFQKNHELLGTFAEHPKVQKLLKISDGWFTVEPAKNDGIIINDLRFGQRDGWERGEGKFVFSYHIYSANDEVKIEEVEKDFGEGKRMLEGLINRVRGQETD